MQEKALRERVERLFKQIADLGIEPSRVPEIVDRVVDLVFELISAASDGRVTLGEIANILWKLNALSATIRDARSN